MEITSRFALVLLLFTTFAFTSTPENKSKPLIIVIDVSHGGVDTGNFHDMLLEKEIVHQIAQKMAVLNKNARIKLHFTRDTDKTMSLQDRVAFINQLKPDAVLSLHLNGEYSKDISGLRVFYGERTLHDTKTQKLAALIAAGFEINGVYNSRTVTGSAPFYILKHSNAPALLLELGNMDNPSDMQLLQDTAQQEAIAQTILDALERL
jgi:N-acetylmuramoyl-L-alanine amidase